MIKEEKRDEEAAATGRVWTRAELDRVTATDEEMARRFAETYRTPNVLRAIAVAEAGLITWEEACQLFGRAFLAGRELTALVNAR